MNRLAERLVTQLLLVQLGLAAATEILVALFAPKLLLLDEAIIDGSVGFAAWASITVLALEVCATLFLTRRLRACIRNIGMGSAAIDPHDVLALHALPARLTFADVVGSFFIVTASLVPPFRPVTNDLVTQLEIMALAITLGSVASLLGYVTMRAAIARVLELVPEKVTRDAIAILELAPPRVPRVRTRLLFAVALPVGFVALGASLLVFAHVRTFDGAMREADATELVRGAFELVNGFAAGRNEAAAAAAKAGFDVRFDGVPGTYAAEHEGDDTMKLTVPLDDVGATVRFRTTNVPPATVVYVLLIAAVATLAAFIGSRFGALFASDVAIVTREVRNLGVADVMRGTRVHRAPRFLIMGRLASAIDDLGTIFREFASTQEKAIDARAAAERMRGLFLASMSHDLKAPLNAILGFAELASRNALTPSQRESLTIIEQRGRELLHLIETILDAARTEAGEFVVTLEPCNLGDLVTAAVLDARELTGEGDVAILAEIEPHVPRIYVDPQRVVQALTLVVLTGVRYAEEGVVRVRATMPEPGQRLRLEVEVPGRGVPRGEVEKIFEAFKDPERARRHGSLGLGLSLARSIFEQHGGAIAAMTTEKTGTVFHVTLPVMERPSARISRVSLPAPPSRR